MGKNLPNEDAAWLTICSRRCRRCRFLRRCSRIFLPRSMRWWRGARGFRWRVRAGCNRVAGRAGVAPDSCDGVLAGDRRAGGNDRSSGGRDGRQQRAGGSVALDAPPTFDLDENLHERSVRHAEAPAQRSADRIAVPQYGADRIGRDRLYAYRQRHFGDMKAMKARSTLSAQALMRMVPGGGGKIGASSTRTESRCASSASRPCRRARSRSSSGSE